MAATGLLLTLLTIIWGGARGYGVLSEKQATQTKETVELKDEGCKPARKNTTDVAVIKTRLDSIDASQRTMQKDIGSMETQQKAILNGIGRIEEKIK